jgi:hypothetical protein
MALAGCTVTGDVYGGGEGLSLSWRGPDGALGETSWPGAARGELRAAANGEAFDPVAVGVAPTDGGFAVRVIGDPFTVDEVLDGLGVQCDTPADTYEAAVATDGMGLFVRLSGDGYALIRAATDSGGTVLAGSRTAPVEWVVSGASCSPAAATELTMTWSFDEDVHARTRCVLCDAIDLGDVSFDL